MARATSDPDPDIYYLNLYFEDFEQVVEVFDDALHRIRRQAGPSGEKFGVVRNALMKLSGKQIVHNYGRIDRDPNEGEAKRRAGPDAQ